jgi:hypothetical protein
MQQVSLLDKITIPSRKMFVALDKIERENLLLLSVAHYQ